MCNIFVSKVFHQTMKLLSYILDIIKVLNHYDCRYRWEYEEHHMQGVCGWHKRECENKETRRHGIYFNKTSIQSTNGLMVILCSSMNASLIRWDMEIKKNIWIGMYKTKSVEVIKENKTIKDLGVLTSRFILLSEHIGDLVFFK